MINASTRTKVPRKIPTVDIMDFVSDNTLETSRFGSGFVVSVSGPFGTTRCVISDNIVYPILTDDIGRSYACRRPSGVVVNKTLVLNGDIFPNHIAPSKNLNEFLSVEENKNICTVSFLALALLANYAKTPESANITAILAVAKDLVSGKIGLVDYTPEEFRSLSAQELNKLNTFVPHSAQYYQYLDSLTPPEKGFTCVGQRWHRPATALFAFKKESWLLGADEDTYFGVLLCDHPKTVNGAFTSLIPRPIRNKSYKRQGEWFAYEVKDSDVPSIVDCVGFNDGHNDESISLPVEDVNSNRHNVSGEYVIAKSGQIFARNFKVQHLDPFGMETSEHSDMNIQDDKWYSFIRNTAKRSVSTGTGGVD